MQVFRFCCFTMFREGRYLDCMLSHLSHCICWIHHLVPTVASSHESFVIFLAKIHHCFLFGPERSCAALVLGYYSVELAIFLSFEESKETNIATNNWSSDTDQQFAIATEERLDDGSSSEELRIPTFTIPKNATVDRL